MSARFNFFSGEKLTVRKWENSFFLRILIFSCEKLWYPDSNTFLKSKSTNSINVFRLMHYLMSRCENVSTVSLSGVRRIDGASHICGACTSDGGTSVSTPVRSSVEVRAVVDHGLGHTEMIQHFLRDEPREHGRQPSVLYSHESRWKHPTDGDWPGEGVVKDEGILPGISDLQLPLDRLFVRVTASQRNQDLWRTRRRQPHWIVEEEWRETFVLQS